jgi:hypothetical protein
MGDRMQKPRVTWIEGESERGEPAPYGYEVKLPAGPGPDGTPRPVRNTNAWAVPTAMGKVVRVCLETWLKPDGLRLESWEREAVLDALWETGCGAPVVEWFKGRPERVVRRIAPGGHLVDAYFTSERGREVVLYLEKDRTLYIPACVRPGLGRRSRAHLDRSGACWLFAEGPVTEDDWTRAVLNLLEDDAAKRSLGEKDWVFDDGPPAR